MDYVWNINIAITSGEERITVELYYLFIMAELCFIRYVITKLFGKLWNQTVATDIATAQLVKVLRHRT